MKAAHRFLAALLALAAVPASVPAARADELVIIGTAAFSGVYHQVGAALCRFVNVKTHQHGTTCRAEESGGSVANVAGITRRDVQFAIVQEDVLYDAVRGQNGFQSAGANEKLRVVAYLYREYTSLVVSAAAASGGLEGLRGKRINIGPPGAGYRVTAERILAAQGLTPGQTVTAFELAPPLHGAALCDDRIDAFFYVVGQPSENLLAPIRRCNAALAPLPDAVREALVRQFPYYQLAQIPSGLYPNQNAAIPTVSVRAALVTSADTRSALVAMVLRSLMREAAQFRRLHPVLREFAEESAFVAPIAPLHDGTLAYMQNPSGPQ